MNSENIGNKEIYSLDINSSFPVGVYYIDMANMFMQGIRYHWHEYMEIDLVTKGAVHFTINEEDVVVPTGSAILINSNRIHGVMPRRSQDAVMISLLFHPDYIFDAADSLIKSKYLSPLVGDEHFAYTILNSSSDHGRAATDLINQIFTANLNKQYGYELTTKGLLCSLWLALLNGHVEQHSSKVNTALIDEKRVKDTINYIHDNFGANITLDMLSDITHVSTSECCRCFKRVTSHSPFEYLMQARIYEAAYLMQRADEKASSMNGLALSVGFNNSSYFNRVFKKYLGCTPLSYQKYIQKVHRAALSPHGIPLSTM